MPDPISPPRSASTPGRVTIIGLVLHDLRNYASLDVRFDGRFIVVTGPNGAGKTNLLEAISLLAPGRGLRRAPFDEIVRRGATGGWAVSATVDHEGEETRIGTGTVVGSSGDMRNRRIRINGADATSADALLDYLRVLWLTPAMDGLFMGPGAERRRFLDRLVLTIDAEHARRTRDFDRLLTQRNRLLQDEGASAWLDAVEAQVAPHGVALALARAETAALISRQLSAATASAFPIAQIQLVGEFENAVVGRKASEAELWYRSALAANRGADRAAGRALVGPHRSDLEVTFAERGMPAALSSTGEQKALLISLILAHAELVAAIAGMTPVLLLDEIAAHLDRDRRAALFARLQCLGAQVFMTGTEAALFGDLPGDAVRHGVADGGVFRLE